MDSFKLEKQITNSEDYLFIITALMGMCSDYDNKNLETTLEKLLSISRKEKNIRPKIKLDFSVSREGNNIDEYLKIIEKAIDEEHIIEFEYTDSYGDKVLRLAEPIGAIYKWYAWYVLAYCCNKKDYRLFKVARMRNLKELEEFFSVKHENIDKLIAHQEQQDNRTYINAKILCKEEIRVSIEEYFPSGRVKVLEDGDFILQFTLPDNEIGWKGILLTYGNKIKIIEPEELREEFVSKAKEISDVYR